MDDGVKISLGAASISISHAIKQTKDKNGLRLPCVISHGHVEEAVTALYKSLINTSFPGLVE